MAVYINQQLVILWCLDWIQNREMNSAKKAQPQLDVQIMSTMAVLRQKQIIRWSTASWCYFLHQHDEGSSKATLKPGNTSPGKRSSNLKDQILHDHRGNHQLIMLSNRHTRDLANKWPTKRERKRKTISKQFHTFAQDTDCVVFFLACA